MWKFDEGNDSKARNRLSLTARVQAIQAYEKTPNYSKVGLMFKCSSKQIRTIVKNKDRIMALYSSLPRFTSEIPDEDKPSNKRRLKKVSLLGVVMYEWFLRARRNPSICIISYKLIQDVALEVKKILNVENFFPTNAWLLHFRQKFNISDSDMKVQSNDPGPTELNIEQIIADVVIREKNNKNYVEQSSLGAFGSYDESSTSSTQLLSMNDTEMMNRTSFITTSDTDDEEPPSKYPKLEPIDVIEIESDDEDDDDDVSGHTEKTVAIKTIDQALQHLKPLEDFALMREDYRVIGLITQLEGILKSSKN